MILDAQALLSDAQALTATAASTNIYDAGADRDLGVGEPLGVAISVDVAADFTSTNETYQFDIETDDNSSFSSATVIARRIIVAGSLTAGARFVIPLPHDNERYLRINYTLGGTTPTVTVTAWIAPLSFIEKNQQYADGLTIS